MYAQRKAAHAAKAMREFRLQGISFIYQEDVEQPNIAEVGTERVSKTEIRRAVKSLGNDQAPGEDIKTSELLKADFEFTTN